MGFAFDFGGMNAVGPPGTYGFLKLEITDNTDSSYFVCWGGCTVGMFSPWAFLIAQVREHVFSHQSLTISHAFLTHFLALCHPTTLHATRSTKH